MRISIAELRQAVLDAQAQHRQAVMTLDSLRRRRASPQAVITAELIVGSAELALHSAERSLLDFVEAERKLEALRRRFGMK